MLNLKLSYGLTTILLTLGSAHSAAAQTADIEKPAIYIAAVQDQVESRIRREVQPITYWVDSASLNLRDNPVSGKVLGTLEFGQKVLAYSQYENWVRISTADENPTWINSDFLSNSRITWASYNRVTPTRANDVISVRIKDSEDRKKRIFAVRLKSADTGNVLVTTREDTAGGIIYQNRFVSCNGQRPLGIRLVGEGRNFLGAQNDVRNLKADIYEAETINDKAANSTEIAISNFACKSPSF